MEKLCLNNDWNFRFGENVGDESSDSYAQYSHIGLPHSFGIPYYGENDFYVGYGCYQKALRIDEAWLKNQILLEFGAVFQVAEVYINGKHVGSHQGGYTAFVLNITDDVQKGTNNLFIRVNNLWSPTIAPRAGEHVFNGGIYRDVQLLLYPPSHIDWYGTFVKTQPLDGNRFEITVETDTIACDGLTLSSDIIDPQGACVAHAETQVQGEHTLQKMILDGPSLWDIDHPCLYRLRSCCGEDSLVTEFGIRTIRWEKDGGFFLNNRRLPLEGANVHQDHGGWADAVTHAGIRRDVAMMKACGFNFIRGSHYPHHTEFAKECDRQGLLFWSEGVFWGMGNSKKDGYWNSSAMPLDKKQHRAFEASLKQTLAEMIRTNRNSPSIIVWSMGNEMFFSGQSVMQDARDLAARLVEYSHQLDGSRPAGLGGVQREDFDAIGDVAGYNGDGAVLFKNPPKPSMVSEYGSIAAYRPGKYDLYETKGSDEYYPWRAGRAIWCGFHHGSIAGIGNLGIVDLYRLPLNAWYCHREKLTGIAPPAQTVMGIPHHIKLRTDQKEIRTDGTDDCMLVAEIFDRKNRRVKSDADMTIEVVSGPGLLPTGKKMVFSQKTKSCFDGACAIEMRAYYAGGITVRAAAEGLLGDELRITALGEAGEAVDINYPVAPVQKAGGKSKKTDIISNRPVAVSSEAIAGSSLAITSQAAQPYWAPAPTDSNPWILLDMEKCYQSFSILISKAGFSPTSARISASIEKEEWRPVASLHFALPKKRVKVELPREVRYLKMELSAGIKLKKIQIFEL